MSDAELQAWYNQVRDITTSPQTRDAHLRLSSDEGGKKSKAKPQADISRYV